MHNLKLLILAYWLTVGFCPPLLAFMDGYIPLSKTETNKPFPVKYCGLVGPESPKNLPAGPFGLSTRTNQQGDLVLFGRDRLKIGWTVTICGSGVGGQYHAYVADLDKNGISDLILICETGGCGLAPTSHLLCFLFDEGGRPIPFTADGYFDYNKNCIHDLLDTDGDGKAERVYMNFDDGYWITSLLIRADRWFVNLNLGIRLLVWLSMNRVDGRLRRLMQIKMQ